MLPTIEMLVFSP